MRLGSVNARHRTYVSLLGATLVQEARTIAVVAALLAHTVAAHQAATIRFRTALLAHAATTNVRRVAGGPTAAAGTCVGNLIATLTGTRIAAVLAVQ